MELKKSKFDLNKFLKKLNLYIKEISINFSVNKILVTLKKSFNYVFFKIFFSYKII